jgi:hypothetical protein
VELRVDREKLKARRLFVGTPMYGGQCHAEYTFSIARLSRVCAELGIGLRLHFLANESLIMRARNATVDEFLRSGDTHLLFIDADMGFDPMDAIYLLAMQDPDPAVDDHDVVAAPYPLKLLAWDNIAKAVKMGLADTDPRILEKYASRIVMAPTSGGPIVLQKPTEVNAAGTGFLMARRATFERFQAAHPGLAYTPDENLAAAGKAPGGFAFFDTGIDNKASNIAEELALFLQARPEATRDEIAAFVADPQVAMKRYTNNFLSEDYMFCKRVREAEMKVWLCPWMQLTHSGSYTFSASLQHVGALNPRLE